jgi:hypothetical protein
MEIHYTEHALLRMSKRSIEPEWVEWVIQNPALRLDDDNDPELEHCLAKVPELASPALTGVALAIGYRGGITLYPDRNMKGKI